MMITYTAYDRHCSRTMLRSYTCFAAALAQAARDDAEPAGNVIPFAITTPHQHIEHAHLRRMLQIWRDLTPTVPSACF